jgi:hypothetical protein
MAEPRPQDVMQFVEGNISPRKVRLAAVAIACALFPYRKQEEHLKALTLAEQLADGQVTEEDRTVAFERLERAGPRLRRQHKREGEHTQSIALALLEPKASCAQVTLCVTAAQDSFHRANNRILHRGMPRKDRDFCNAATRGLVEAIPEMAGNILCEIAGRPARWKEPPAAIALSGEVRALAEAAYLNRLEDGKLDPTNLAILADALEIEASCSDSDVIAQLRSKMPQYRGCWALDLVLGKN